MSQVYDLSSVPAKALSLLGALVVTAALFIFVVPLSHWLAKEPAVIAHTTVETVTLPPPPPPPTSEELTQVMKQAAEAVAAAPRPLGSPIELEALPTNSPALAGVDTGLLYADEFPIELSGLDEMPIFEVVDLDRIPQRVSNPPLVKPLELERAGISGEVRMKVLISPQGYVSVLEVLSFDHKRLIPHARRFAEKCRFEPPMKNNQAVTAFYVFPVRY